MEVYELPITPEESKNYHSFFYKLKALTLREWMRSYITAVIYAVVLCGVIYFISDTLFIRFWFDTPLAGKGVLFFFIFILAAAQRSRNIQLRKMLQKYFINNMPQEFLAGGIQLKKIRVQKDRLVVYYKRFRADDYKEACRRDCGRTFYLHNNNRQWRFYEYFKCGAFITRIW